MSSIPATAPPDWLVHAIGVEPIDVRQMLSMGQDPLFSILQPAQAVEPGGFLVVDAPFNPTPLRRLLAGNGFSSFGRKLAGGHWRVFFRKDGGAQWQQDGDVDVSSDGAVIWSQDGTVHIDVRPLPPPVPMVAILRLIESSPQLGCLVVHHQREPVHLLPELAERGWRVESMQQHPDLVVLRLEKNP